MSLASLLVILSVRCTCRDGRKFPRFVPNVLACLSAGVTGIGSPVKNETFRQTMQSANSLALESAQLGKSLIKS